MKIERGKLTSPTGKGILLDPIFPNAGVQMWYQTQLDTLVMHMHADIRGKVLAAAREVSPILGADAMMPTRAAGVVFRWGGRVLLVRRSDGSGWGFPGGGIEPGEDAEEAARREVREEIGVDYKGPLAFERVQSWGNVLFTTFVADIKGDTFPRPVLNDEHSEFFWALPDWAIQNLPLHLGVRATLSQPAPMAADVMTMTQLQRALEKWGNQWIKRFDLMSTRIADDFATRAKKATEVAMQAQLKKAGFTVPFKPTRKSIEAYKAVAAEQVGLIKSIPQKYLTDVQTQVWQSVKRGSDLATLSKNLEHTYSVTKRRAALIARDQNAKAKAVIEAERHQELGITQAIWMHSKAGKEPRPTHVKMNNKLYNLNRGMWDSDEGEFVHPGQLINCRCTMRPYIPGFEGARPEWEITQT